MKSYITLYGSGDEEQEVEIEFHFLRCGYWFAPESFEIIDLVILTPLEITPSDLYSDLQLGISTALWIGVDKVRIECEVQEAVEMEMIFI